MKQLLTVSRQRSYLSCPRKHFWSYEFGLRQVESAEALRFGSAWHEAMQARWNGLTYEEAIARALPEGVPLDAYLCETLGALLHGYYLHRGECDEGVKIQPERAYEADIPGSRAFKAAGKLDGIGIDPYGAPLIIESKTTSDSLDPDSDYWQRLRFDLQVLQYVDAARASGWDVRRVLYDVTRKPTIKPKEIANLDEQGIKVVLDAQGQRVIKKDGTPRETGDGDKGYILQTHIETPDEFGQRLRSDIMERPEFYFQRREVDVLDQDLESFRIQRLVLGRIILEQRRAQARVSKPCDAWPRNVSPMVCGFCEFNTFCLQNIVPTEQQLPAGFRLAKDVNEELCATPC